MDAATNLLAAFADEDRLLMELIQRCRDEARELRGPGGGLSLKETLGHLAFWDSFAVGFFQHKLTGGDANDLSDIDFEKRNRQEMRRLRGLPFDEALALYREATASLAGFLSRHWRDLSERERADFLVPLKHRRHHRMLLEKALASALSSEPRRDAGQA
jgi:hypothetical protein